jgi:hypothetical protein
MTTTTNNNQTKGETTMSKYTVSIWPANPRQQRTEEYDSKSEAVAAARRCIGCDEGQTEVSIERDGERIAAATVTDKRLTWL